MATCCKFHRENGKQWFEMPAVDSPIAPLALPFMFLLAQIEMAWYGCRKARFYLALELVLLLVSFLFMKWVMETTKFGRAVTEMERIADMFQTKIHLNPESRL